MTSIRPSSTGSVMRSEQSSRHGMPMAGDGQLRRCPRAEAPSAQGEVVTPHPFRLRKSSNALGDCRRFPLGPHRPRYRREKIFAPGREFNIAAVSRPSAQSTGGPLTNRIDPQLLPHPREIK